MASSGKGRKVVAPNGSLGCVKGENFYPESNFITVEPRYNDPQYNDIPGITINMLCPGKSYSKMYGTEPRYNDLRYNDIPDITMSF